MTKPIAIFYHGLFFLGDPPRYLPNAERIISGHILQMLMAGLFEIAGEIYFGINGAEESHAAAKNIIPSGAVIKFHGLQCRNENRTVEMLLEWSKTHPGWNVLYLHAKGSSYPPGSDHYQQISKPWRETMSHDLITNWRQCVADLETHDIACTDWRWNQADGSQHLPAGNFLWLTSDFAAKLPSLYLRARIKQDGIDALSSRYESEVCWGNGPRPTVKAYRARLPY